MEMKKFKIAFLAVGTLWLASCTSPPAVQQSASVPESSSEDTSFSGSSISSSSLENQAESENPSNKNSHTSKGQSNTTDETFYYRVVYPEYEEMPQYEQKETTNISAEVQSYMFLDEVVWYPTFGNGKAYFCSEDSKGDELLWHVNVFDLNTQQNQQFQTECIAYDINEYKGSYYWVEKYTDNLGDWRIWKQDGINGEREIIYTPDPEFSVRAPRIQIYNNMIVWNQYNLSEDGEDKFAVQVLNLETKELQTVNLTDYHFFYPKSTLVNGVIAYGGWGKKNYKLQAFDLNTMQKIAEVELDTLKEESDAASSSRYNIQALEDAGYDMSEFELDEDYDWPYDVMYQNGYFYFQPWDGAYPYIIDTHKHDLYPLEWGMYNVTFIGKDKLAWTTRDSFCIFDVKERKFDMRQAFEYDGKRVHTLHGFYVRDNALMSRGYIDIEGEGKSLEGVVYIKLDSLD